MDHPIHFPEPLPSAPSRPALAPAPIPPFERGHGRQGSPGEGPGEGPGEELHLLDYVRVLHKRRWTAITAFVVVLGTVAVFTFTATPIFTARTQVLIESDTPDIAGFRSPEERNQGTNDYYQTQYRILQSRALIRRTLDQSKFWDHPVLRPPPRDVPEGFLKQTLSASTAWVTSLWKDEAPMEPIAEGETRAQSRVIDAFLGRLTIAPVRNSRLVDIRFASADPAFSADAANAVARAYIDQNLEFKFLATKEAADWLTQRLGEQRKEVESSEQALQRYRERTADVSLEERQNIVVQRLAELNAAVTRARTDRIQREAAYKQLTAIQRDRAALDTFPSILSNGFIQQLKAELLALQNQESQVNQKLGERHPDMIKLRSAIQNAEIRINAEIQKVVQAVRNEYETALTQEQSLTAALAQQQSQAIALNRNSIGYGALQRDADSNRQIFQGLLQRTRETDITSELKANNIRIVDVAEVPQVRSSPNVRNNLIIGFTGGLMLAFGLVFFFEYVDNRLKSPDEIKKELGLPFLGIVPVVESGVSTMMLKGDVPHGFSEAFRAIRTNVLFSTADEGSKVLVVTSTGPGEGKTMTACNVAIALAQSGARVLVVDCDMRRPRIHEVFSLPQEPGLSNVLVGNAKASDAVRKGGTTNLWVLAAGRIPPNPAELLGSKRFQDFLATLRDHFEWVILDTPPVMAVSDGQILAHQATGVLFVVGAEMTSRGAARTALDQLDGAKARYVGAVLNRVDLTHNAYYYSNYYKKDYERYHLKSS